MLLLCVVEEVCVEWREEWRRRRRGEEEKRRREEEREGKEGRG